MILLLPFRETDISSKETVLAAFNAEVEFLLAAGDGSHETCRSKLRGKTVRIEYMGGEVVVINVPVTGDAVEMQL